jgi:hypothetical protein
MGRFPLFCLGWLVFRTVGELIREVRFSFPDRGFRLAVMNGIPRDLHARRIGFLAVLLLSTASLKANPVAPGQMPFSQLGTFTLLTLAALVEALCVRLFLRRWRRPTLLILWLLIMHLLTYPLFLGVLWFSYGTHPVVGVAIGEGLIVLIEGGLICLICRFMSSAKSELPAPTLAKSLLASLLGNIGSAVAFPLLVLLLELIGSGILERFQ